MRETVFFGSCGVIPRSPVDDLHNAIKSFKILLLMLMLSANVYREDRIAR